MDYGLPSSGMALGDARIFARDCVGGQTLYAAQLDGRIVFATDLRAFHASGMLRALDEEAVAQFLHYLYVPAPRTLVAGCTAVLPGHVLSIGDSTRHEKYATPRFVKGPTIENADELERETERHLPAFEDRLLTAVADCVPERGRVALALSGGKDSSVLAIALSKVCPGPGTRLYRRPKRRTARRITPRRARL